MLVYSHHQFQRHLALRGPERRAIAAGVRAQHPRTAGTCGAVRCSWEHAPEPGGTNFTAIHTVMQSVCRGATCALHTLKHALCAGRLHGAASSHGGLPPCSTAEQLGTGQRSQPPDDDHVNMRHGMAEVPFASLSRTSAHIWHAERRGASAAPPRHRRHRRCTSSPRPRPVQAWRQRHQR